MSNKIWHSLTFKRRLYLIKIECRDVMKNCHKWKRQHPPWFGIYGLKWGNRCKLSRSHPDNHNKLSTSPNNKDSPNYPIEIGCQKTCKNACSERRITKGTHDF